MAVVKTASKTAAVVRAEEHIIGLGPLQPRRRVDDPSGQTEVGLNNWRGFCWSAGILPATGRRPAIDAGFGWGRGQVVAGYAAR